MQRIPRVHAQTCDRYHEAVAPSKDNRCNVRMCWIICYRSGHCASRRHVEFRSARHNARLGFHSSGMTTSGCGRGEFIVLVQPITVIRVSQDLTPLKWPKVASCYHQPLESSAVYLSSQPRSAWVCIFVNPSALQMAKMQKTSFMKVGQMDADPMVPGKPCSNIIPPALLCKMHPGKQR